MSPPNSTVALARPRTVRDNLAMTPTSTSSPAAADRVWARTGLLVTSAALVVLVLAQASLAGQALFNEGDIGLHGIFGNVSFALGLAAAIFAGLGRVPRWLLAASALTLACLFGQTGLGYAGRESLDAATWHIPLGVAIFGLATVQLMGAIGLVRSPAGRSSLA